MGITVYFWRVNIIGMHESSDKALRIMQLTTVMGVLIIAWSALTLIHSRAADCMPPPLHPVLRIRRPGEETNRARGGWRICRELSGRWAF